MVGTICISRVGVLVTISDIMKRLAQLRIQFLGYNCAIQLHCDKR